MAIRPAAIAAWAGAIAKGPAPFGAIHVNEERLAVVHENACRGCGVCVDVCPRGVLRLMPVEHAVHRMCSAMERGKVVRENCSAGLPGVREVRAELQVWRVEARQPAARNRFGKMRGLHVLRRQLPDRRTAGE